MLIQNKISDFLVFETESVLKALFPFPCHCLHLP